MGAASYLQASFIGGEWSPLMQGRVDLPKYRSAMNICQNAIPLEEGSLPRRSGTRQLAPTRSGAPGRIIGYAPVQDAPYLLEFTDGHLRFFSGYDLVKETPYQVSNVSTDTPAQVTLGSSSPPPWVTGDQVEFVFDPSLPQSLLALARNLQFRITVLSTVPLVFSIADAVTGAPVPGSALGWQTTGKLSVARIVDLATPWVNKTWQKARWIPFNDAQNVTQGIVLTGGRPYRLIAATPGAGTTKFTLEPVSFIDGPYLDVMNGANAKPTAGSTTVSYSISGGASWQPAPGLPSWLGRYNTGDMVEYEGSAWMSTTGGTGGTNVNQIPGVSSAWVKVSLPADNAAGPPFPEWVSGGNYTPWNGGSQPGSIVSHAGEYWVARNRGTSPFSNTVEPGSTGNLMDSWLRVDINQTETFSGLVDFAITFTPWSTITNYSMGDVVSYGSSSYISQTSNNLNQIPGPGSEYWTQVSAGLPFGPNGAQQTDVGRLMRFFYQPAEWNSSTTYSSGQNVTFNGAYYNALVSNAGAQPDISLRQWQPVIGAAFWTPAVITKVYSPSAVQAQILGQALTDETTITRFQVGVYTDTNSTWPTCGTFYQGRLWLGGAIPNRFDASTTDDALTMTPTGVDGTVADNNGISETINSEDSELIQWMRGVQQGIMVGTLSREWLINASVTSDPITPATIEINPVTKYGSAFIEPQHMGLALVFVQKFKRQLMEMVANVFSGKYNAPNLALTAKHLTTSGIEEIAYQEELTPVIWARMADGSLAGCTYRRISAFQTDNPVMLTEPSTFAAWHRHVLGNGRSVRSITTTLTPGGIIDQLAMVTQDADGVNWVEVMMPLCQVDDTLQNAWYLDGATVPSGGVFVTYGSPPVTYTRFYGLGAYVGKTVSVWACGLDCGDYQVSPGGYVDVPLGAAGGLYTRAAIEANSVAGGVPVGAS